MILITGAAQGLGAAIAIELAKSGHNVLIHHNKTDPSSVLKECRSFGVQAESFQGDLSQSVEHPFSGITGLVNNVGNWSEDTPRNSTIDLMQINLEVPMRLTEKLLPSIEKAKGHIVNIGTVGISKPTVTCTSYAITKAALWKYTHSLAKAVPFVKTNMVSPGALENTVGNPTDNLVPLGEVARLVAFLFSSQSITGQNIEVAAGFIL